MEGSGAGGPRGEGGEVFHGLAAAPGLGSCATDELFLGMRFVAQEPIYLHHRLRGQLAQHLEENGVVERAVHAGSLKKAGGSRTLGAAQPGQVAGKKLQRCPCLAFSP